MQDGRPQPGRSPLSHAENLSPSSAVSFVLDTPTWSTTVGSLRNRFVTFLRMNTIIAYLDPGTGSIILQTAVAGFFGALVAIKIYWSKITGFFRKDKDDSSAAAKETDKPQDPS